MIAAKQTSRCAVQERPVVVERAALSATRAAVKRNLRRFIHARRQTWRSEDLVSTDTPPTSHHELAGLVRLL